MPNPYQLAFPARLGLTLSVREFSLSEALDTPYQLTVAITCPDADLPLATLIDQPVSFTITPAVLSPDLAIPGLDILASQAGLSRSWHGVVRQASRGRSNHEETRYTFVIGPRLARLADGCTTRLFQNSSIPQVIESVLRQQDLSGADFSFQLTGNQATHAHLTQWRESDLQFIQRLAATAGIFYQFTQAEDGKEVLAFGNNLEHYHRGRLQDVPLRAQAGLESHGAEAVSHFDIQHRTMLHSVRRKDFNYLTASTTLDRSSGFAGEVAAARGVDYAWGEGGRDAAETESLAQLRHQASLARQCLASGGGNVLHTRPGEVLRLARPFADAPHGWLIVEASHHGQRDQAYHNTFTAIPAHRIWRPALQARPRIHGTLPAMVVSPGENSYRYPYLDELGRYRVRFLFDLDSWSPAGDSRAVRLAKPFAGGRFGFHLPLHAGTMVNLGFDDGDPDHPYIASVLHDSSRPDHIDSGWNTRNVILTRSHNKLRMEDLQGKEHIKLATEYGKTQLNIGHLVDAQRQPRGAGFELRSDQWGAIRAGKGLLLSAHAQQQANGHQNDLSETCQALDDANQNVRAMSHAAKTANAEELDWQAQHQLLQQQIKQLQAAVLVATSPAGIALSTPGTMHLNTGKTLAISSSGDSAITIMKKLTVNVSEVISLFALKAGIKLFSNKGPIKIQAQSDELQLASMEELNISSSNGKVVINAKEIMLAAGGSWISIGSEGLKLGSGAGPITHFGDFGVVGSLAKSIPLPSFTKVNCKSCLERAFKEGQVLTGGHN